MIALDEEEAPMIALDEEEASLMALDEEEADFVVVECQQLDCCSTLLILKLLLEGVTRVCSKRCQQSGVLLHFVDCQRAHRLAPNLRLANGQSPTNLGGHTFPCAYRNGTSACHSMPTPQ